MATLRSPTNKEYHVSHYENLKGVDFTQNASDVFSRRSPTAINMISNEGGNPVKRCGWEKICETGFNIKDMWSFKYNGEEHLIGLLQIQGSIGDDYYYVLVRWDSFNKTWVEISDGDYPTFANEKPCVFKFGTVTQETFGAVTPYYTSNGYFLPAVSKYTETENGYAFKEIEPYIPTIIIGEEFTGGGASYEAVNLLTNEVKESYVAKETVSATGEYPLESSIQLSAKADRDNPIIINLKFAEVDMQTGVRTGNIIYVNQKYENSTWSYNYEEPTDNINWSSSFDSQKPRFDTVTDNDFGTLISLESAKYIPPTVSGEDNCTVQYSIDNVSDDRIALAEVRLSKLYENRLFVSGASGLYKNYVWYSAYDNPSYFPDTNYSVVGSNETAIYGLEEVGEYLGIIKESSSETTSVYLMYSTTFESDTTFAVKQFVSGVGAVSTNSFATVSDELLFLAKDGIYALHPDTTKNRSFYINKRLCQENNLEDAVAVSWNGYYILCVNSRCYILDTRQKSSWRTEWTNFVYESYYWENVDAIKLCEYMGRLHFINYSGQLCRFHLPGDKHCYSDGNWKQKTGFNGQKVWLVDGFEVESANQPTKEVQIGTYIDESGVIQPIMDTVTCGTEVWAEKGEPIYCEWSTPLDSDGAVQLYKSLKKKGSLATIVPSASSSAKLYIDVDGANRIYIGKQTTKRFFFDNVSFATGEFTFISSSSPIDVFFNKKVKKYKRLQLIVVNDENDESLELQEITKTFVVNGYSKRKPSDGKFTKER